MPDFVTDEPELDFDPTNPALAGDDVVAFNRWLAQNAANMPNHGTFQPNAGVPHFTRDYSRFFALLAVKLLKYYSAHQSTINNYISSGAIAAFNAALAYIGELSILDQAGPN